MNQTTVELNAHLKDSVGFLVASCASFDSGFLGEAKRLATTVRVMVHDTHQSKSLLGLLGYKDKIRYIDTAAQYDPANLLAYHGLVGFRFEPQQAPSYWAPLGKGPPTRYNRPPTDFGSWWNAQVINDKAGGIFTRRDLVLALANKDGGAHVDPKLDAHYASLTRGNSLGWVASHNGAEHSLSGVELYSVRQVSYELLESLRLCGIVAA